MHEFSFLRDFVVLLAAAIGVVLLFKRLRLPAVAGYIVAGAIMGPTGFGWVREVERVEQLAEIGVALLLFTIGLEFALDDLRRLGRVLVIGGGTQTVITIAAVAAASAWLGYPAPRGLFFGFLIALSSTAIVLKELAERGEVDAPHGRLVVGMLLFQDLMVVPMILLVPALAGQGGDARSVVGAIVTAAIVVAAALALARLVVPRILDAVARARSRDLFVLALTLIGAGITWATSMAGLSLALGAFLAGVVLAESEYGHQALADSLPLRDLFTSLFFVSMGMLVDLRASADQAAVVLALVGSIVPGKAALATFAGMALRLPVRVALLAGFSVAQVGEFSFVLARQGADVGLLAPSELRTFFAASVLTMLVSPMSLRFGPGVAARASGLPLLDRLTAPAEMAAPPPRESRAGHVVILGYGVGGEMLAEILSGAQVPYVVVDLNLSRIRRARQQGLNAMYGDVTNRAILESAGVPRARQVTVLLNDPEATVRAVRSARELAPGAVIIARARYVGDVPRLLAAGADEAVAQEFEASFAIIERVTREARAPRPGRAEMRVRLGLEQPTFESGAEARLPVGLEVESVAVAEGSWIAGRTLAEADLRRRTGATLVALSRGEATAVHPAPGDTLEAGDLVTLVGDRRQIALATDLIHGGPPQRTD
ncbi:MAG: cation:proton antiporter [Vicinamibacterales bacterium]